MIQTLSLQPWDLQSYIFQDNIVSVITLPNIPKNNAFYNIIVFIIPYNVTKINSGIRFFIISDLPIKCKKTAEPLPRRL